MKVLESAQCKSEYPRRSDEGLFVKLEKPLRYGGPSICEFRKSHGDVAEPLPSLRPTCANFQTTAKVLKLRRHY